MFHSICKNVRSQSALIISLFMISLLFGCISCKKGENIPSKEQTKKKKIKNTTEKAKDLDDFAPEEEEESGAKEEKKSALSIPTSQIFVQNQQRNKVEQEDFSHPSLEEEFISNDEEELVEEKTLKIADTTKSKGSFDYQNFALALKNVNNSGMVNYQNLKNNRSSLDQFVQEIGSFSLKKYRKFSSKSKLAFWLNAYNGLTLQLIINNYPIQSGFFKSFAYPKNSIRQISGAWTTIKFKVMGKTLNLDTIEHKIIRKYFKEPRVHMALVCAAMSCPPLRNEPYIGDKLDSQLDDQARNFLGHSKKFKIDSANGTVYFSKIFSWFGKDFVKKYGTDSKFKSQGVNERAVLNFILKYLSKKDQTYLLNGSYSISYLSYDWTLNQQ